MAILSKQALLDTVNTIIGESTEDNVLEFLENLTDTLDSVESGNGTDWKQKFEDNDKMWKDKYKNRFFSNNSSNGGNSEVDEEETNEDEPPKNFDELFKQE